MLKNWYPRSQCVPQHVPNRSSLLTLSHILLCPKFYSCSLLNNPKEKKITTYRFWDSPKLDYLLNFWVMGQSKMPIGKEKKKIELWGSPQLTNRSHNIPCCQVWLVVTTQYLTQFPSSGTFKLECFSTLRLHKSEIYFVKAGNYSMAQASHKQCFYFLTKIIGIFFGIFFSSMNLTNFVKFQFLEKNCQIFDVTKLKRIFMVTINWKYY